MNNKVDPITLSTIWHFIQRVCREMRETAERTATNVLVVTLHDMAYGIWDSEGRAIAIPEGFPPRLISSAFPIRFAKKKFEGKIYPGDIFLTNSPRAGAVHLADWVFVRPIFYKDELMFWTCMGTHVADSGGAHPGTHFLADDNVAEGLNIPLLKIVEKGEWKEDLAELILENNRLPKMMRHEMSSFMGSTAIAEKRMIELLERYGREKVNASIDAMVERTESAVREEIGKWDEGTWYSEVYTDDDGKTMGAPVAVRCRLTIKNGEVTFDFSDTDPETSGNANAHYHQTLSNIMCTTFLFLGSDLAAFHNEGSMQPIHVITRKGTLVDCNPYALTAGSPAVVGSLTIEALLSVLSQALSHRAIAPYARLAAPILVGRDEKSPDGVYVFSSFSSVAGAGAVHGYDGYQCACDMGTLGVVGKSDSEDEMARFPWDILRCEFQTDSHGAGQWRSSPGIIWEAVNEGGDATNMGGPMSGFTTQAPGHQGGAPTQFNKVYKISEGEKTRVENPRLPIHFKTGDHFIISSGGGAAVGRPEQRDPEAVLRDVKNDLVSVQMAKNVYKVVIDPDNLEINQKETEFLRKRGNLS
ncbi:MAG: hydantoinase B/oxoprolinase family protein [Desulfobacteraceae bacterium]|nr:hydantoinase B/oxoprolinase family protein [Desulfobacteraceae bacterium]